MFFIKKKLGLIQTRGLGDIHIAIPIAFFYYKKNWEIYWPILNKWVQQMEHYFPWINWIPVNEEKEFFYEIPKTKLREIKVDKIIPLYSFLASNPEFSDVPYYKFTSFDQFKYIKAEVPFNYKWKLSECFKRDEDRENDIYKKFVKKKNYIVTHLNASDHIANFDHSVLPIDHQIIPITAEGYVLDWLKTIENAKIIIMTNSVMSNIVDQLSIGIKKYYLPRGNIWFSPVLNDHWIFLKDQNFN